MTRSKKKWVRDYQNEFGACSGLPGDRDDHDLIQIYKEHKRLIHQDHAWRSPDFEGKRKVPFIIHRSAQIHFPVSK